MGYKYTMNPLSQRFTISLFSIFLAYIFSESISLKYHCIFSLYNVTDFTIKKIPTSIKENLLQVPVTDHLTYHASPATTTITSHLPYQTLLDTTHQPQSLRSQYF